MKGTSRRDFLKRSGAGLAASLIPSPGWAAATDPIPRHRALALEGLHAYADDESVDAGGTLRLFVSSTIPYRLSVCRLGLKVDDPAGDLVLHAFPESPALAQPIHPGSYVHVENRAEETYGAISLECWLRPWKLTAAQAVLTEVDVPERCSYGLSLTAAGEAAFYLGDGAFRADGLHAGPRLDVRRWHHLVGTWDGKKKALWVDGRKAGEWAYEGKVASGAAIRLGAQASNGIADQFLDGDLAMPAVYARALGEEEIRARFERKGLRTAEGARSCWPLDEERGDRVKDVGEKPRPGRVVNHATWMIGGPSFKARDVARYGDYDPRTDPSRGHGLRLASDDLYDCRWKPTHEFSIPEDARSGVYAARFDYALDGRKRTYHVTFLVRRPASRPKAPILVLCSTNTWRAYSSTPFAATDPGTHHHWDSWGRTSPKTPGGPPAYSCYRDHEALQPTYQVGVRMPWPVAGPYVRYSAADVGYSHLTRAERFLHAWLEGQGYDYDVIGDLDLHRDPERLRGYKVVVINGHSEYWSAPAYDGVDRYLRDGGNVVALTGNTMFWRVSYDPTVQVMECRKFQGDLGGRAHAAVGELWHSQDGKRGGLLRECGRPAWSVLGLETVGWWGVDPKKFGAYSVDLPDHFLFRGLGLEKGELFGRAPAGIPLAGGHEGDVRLSTLLAATGPAPAGAALPEEPAGMTTLARVVRKGYRLIDYFGRWSERDEAVLAEMIYWERPRGGRVFHAGAIGSGWALSAAPKFQAVLKNVLRHFGVS